MRTIFFLLFFFGFTYICYAQTWSTPVVISNTGYNCYPDFTIDKVGIIHVVWARKIGSNYWKIMYSRSLDDGTNWLPPEDISRNTSLWMSGPQIVVDSLRHLFVSYDYNVGDYTQTKICYIKHNGAIWNQPVFLADTMPGARHNRLAIDNNGRIYCFWFYGNIFYRTMENGNWSGDFELFPWNHDVHFLNRIIVDANNDLYCVGQYRDSGQMSNDGRAIGFSMTAGNWGDHIELCDSLSWGEDVGVKSGGFPVYVWGQLRKDTAFNGIQSTWFASMQPSGISEPKMLANGGVTDPVVAVDINDHIHIVETERKASDTFHQVYYYFDNQKWTNTILQKSKYEILANCLKSDSTFLYLVSCRIDDNDPVQISINFSKREVATAIQEETREPELNIYPNPFSGQFTIRLETQKSEDLKMLLWDQFGRTIGTLYNGKSTPGFTTITIDENTNGMVLNPGIYILSLLYGDKFIYRKVICAKF